MLMVKNRLQRLPAVRLGLIILWLLAWAGAGLAADSAPCRRRIGTSARWSASRLPPGVRLTFAVLGDSRSNPAVFGRVLQQMDRRPQPGLRH